MKNILLAGLIVPFFFLSCAKEPGPGGTSSITGKVYVKDYNADYTEVNDEYYVPKEDVYLIYGDDHTYSESFKTSYDGSYRFDHLQKGKYKVFCYSDDMLDTVAGDKVPVIKEIEITANKQTVEVEDIVIIK